jgi:FtsH-binding integral membrane protein
MANTSLYNAFFKKQRNILKGGLPNSDDIFSLLAMKKQLFFMIFVNLIIQLGITYYIMMNNNIFNKDKDGKEDKTKNMWFRIFLMFILFVLIFVINMPMPIWMRFIVFSIISTIIGLFFSNFKNIYGVDIIKAAIFSTLGIFVTLLIVGIILVSFGVKLGLKTILFLLGALLLLIITKIIFMFAGSYSTFVKTFAVIGLFLFACFIIYDTNVILQRDYQGDFVTASLDYYLDIINIFTNVLQLSGSN